MSGASLVSPATRFDAQLTNTTNRPFAETDGTRYGDECEFPCTPAVERLTQVVVCANAGARSAEEAARLQSAMRMAWPWSWVR